VNPGTSFPDLENIDNLDERKRQMTLEDLLTMRSGTDYHEHGSDSPHDQLNREGRGWTQFILTSAILKARYGVHADRFAADYLFAPLGIDLYMWFKNAEGHPHTGGGLSLRSRDMARFGLLYLREGRWDDKHEESAPREFLYSHGLKAVH
jgi:CubicO group peptidase (beta-lactamase class C family)